MAKKDELEVAVYAAREAGKILMKNYGKVTARYKKDRSLVTKSDLASEKRIKEILKKEFPDCSYLGEESGLETHSSDCTWIIDPLDGTTNYTVQNPFFNVSIAHAIKKDVVIGVVYWPFRDELFHAVKGKGAFLNGRKVSVSKTGKIEDAFIAFCHGNDPVSVDRISSIFPKLKKTTDKTRQIGAAELELSMVGCGRIDGFFMIKQNPWDVASGSLIVKEAGGKVTDIEGKPFTLESMDAVASNGLIHDELLRLLIT